MIIPDFNAYAPKPNLAESYLGGVAAAQRDRAQDMEAAQHAQQLQLAQQKLQQDAVQNNMEFQARQQQLQQQTMLHEQQLRIQEQYNQQRIGMDQLRIEQAGKTLQLKQQQDARLLSDEGEWSKRVQGGEDPKQVALEMGPRAHLPSGAYTSLLHNPDQAMPPAELMDVGNDPSGRFKTIQTGPHTRRVIDTSRSTGDLAERRFEFSKEQAGRKSIADQIKSLERVMAADKVGMFAQSKLDRGGKLTPGQQKAADQYNARTAQIESLRQQLNPAGGKTASETPQFHEGQVITHKKTGDKYRVIGGRPVLMDSSPEQDQETSGEDTMGE
jgi:hypothetical protein